MAKFYISFTESGTGEPGSFNTELPEINEKTIVEAFQRLAAQEGADVPKLEVKALVAHPSDTYQWAFILFEPEAVHFGSVLYSGLVAKL